MLYKTLNTSTQQDLEDLSDGRCRFVIVKDKKWNLIQDKLPDNI